MSDKQRERLLIAEQIEPAKAEEVEQVVAELGRHDQCSGVTVPGRG